MIGSARVALVGRCAAAVAVLIAVGAWIFIRPIEERIAEAEARIRDGRRLIGLQERAVARSRATQRERDHLFSMLERSGLNRSHTGAVARLLTALEDRAAQTGATVLSLAAADARAGSARIVRTTASTFEETPFDVVISGSYPSIVRWTRAMAAGTSAVEIRFVSILPVKRAQQTMPSVLATYHIVLLRRGDTAHVHPAPS